MQNLLKEGPLLNEDGNLDEAGYAFSLVKKYERSKIKAKKSRIKEWDYYYIGNNEKGIALTIDDNSYMGLASVSILDFNKKSYITKSTMRAFTNGKVGLPESSVEGITYWNHGGYELKFENDGSKRILDAVVINYHKNKQFKCHFELKENNEGSMVIATPFDKPKHFYYNQKINCMIAEGYYEFGDERYEFKSDASRAVLDWGRGVWTYKNTWYWSSLSAVSNEKEVGFNLGYGFGDTSAASENMFFYDDKAYKLEDVVFNIPKGKNGKDDFLNPWTFNSQNGDINLTFNPIIDRYSNTNVLIIQSNQHQVFGYFSGSVKVENKVIEFKNLLGFAEKVMNRW